MYIFLWIPAFAGMTAMNYSIKPRKYTKICLSERGYHHE